MSESVREDVERFITDAIAELPDGEFESEISSDMCLHDDLVLQSFDDVLLIDRIMNQFPGVEDLLNAVAIRPLDEVRSLTVADLANLMLDVGAQT